MRNARTILILTAAAMLTTGCAARRGGASIDWTEALRAYRQTRPAAPSDAARSRRASWRADGVAAGVSARLVSDQPQEASPASQPIGAEALREPSYWCDSLTDQAAAELKLFVRESFWDGFRVAFWDVQNAAALAATFGASLAIRETGVDATIAGRIRRHRQLGNFDEPIQLLGNPGTHFAATVVLCLVSTLRHDQQQHELARTLTRALAVNGFSTALLKASTNTSAPDGGRFAWPSGHTSSSFTVAAVLNEYYGPKVGIPAIALAGLVGYQRLDSRVHDFSDVVFGAVLGWVVGTSIARDDRASPPELLGLELVPWQDVETGITGIALRRSW